MRYLVRVFLFNSFSLWFVSQVFPGLVIHGGWQVLLSAGLVLSLLMLLIAPVLKILFIPINILTFGLLSWLVNVAVLYLLTVFVPGVEVTAWIFERWTWSGFVIPQFHISYVISLILVSLTLTFFVNLLHDVSEH